MANQFIEINNNKYFVRTWGNPKKPKILLLHGFPEYSGSWKPLAKSLQNSYYLIAPDQRGFGLSWSPKKQEYYKTSSIIKDLKSLINHFDEDMIVLGHDWGAATAYALAFATPSIIKKLIILNGVHPIIFQRAILSGGEQTKASQYINYLRQDKIEDELKKDNFKKLIQLFSANMDTSWLQGKTKDEYIKEWSRQDKLKTMLNWYRASPIVIPNNRLSKYNAHMKDEELQVNCPHLLIWGKKDTALLQESYRGLENYCNDLEIVTLDDADHWLHHQKPEEISQIIKSWLIKKTIKND